VIYISLLVIGLQYQRLYRALFPRYCHFFSVRNCLWPSKVLQFRDNSYRPVRFRSVCKHIVVNSAIFPEVLELDKW